MSERCEMLPAVWLSTNVRCDPRRYDAFSTYRKAQSAHIHNLLHRSSKFTYFQLLNIQYHAEATRLGALSSCLAKAVAESAHAPMTLIFGVCACGCVRVV